MRLAPVVPLLALAAAATLSACAGGPAVDRGISRLAGKPVLETYNVIGTPSRQVASGADTVYSWETSASGKNYVPNPTMAAGFVSGTPPGMEGGANTGASLGHETTCEVRLTAGSDGRIKKWEFVGPDLACDAVAKRLKAWASSRAS